jgi:hypothetical protein
MSELSLAFLYAWAYTSHEAVGKMLPVNYIDATSVGYEVPDGEPPIQTVEGPVRKIIIKHAEVMPYDG